MILKAQKLIKENYTVESIEKEWVKIIKDQDT